MLKATLSIIETLYGTEDVTNKVTLGAVISEDDAELVNKYISAEIDWGDGSELTIIAPQVSPYNDTATIGLSRSNDIVYITIDPVPYSGTFSLNYGGYAIENLNFNISASGLQSAIMESVEEGEGVKVEGECPEWKLTFGSSDSASKLTTGTGDLYTYKEVATHEYPNGNFLITLLARNYRSPQYDVVTATQQVLLEQELLAKVVSPVLIGPVLASDVGFPNPAQWNFNTLTDIHVLVSSVKMILIVEPGDRLMMPEYGCALRKFIFEPHDSATDQDIHTEIRRAIDTWEPRVKVESLELKRNIPQRSLSVAITLISLLNQERFQLYVELER